MEGLETVTLLEVAAPRWKNCCWGRGRKWTSSLGVERHVWHMFLRAYLQL